MSVVDMLNKKHKVMNCVFEILYDLYGEPVWLNKPKDGQEPEKIIEQWIKELGDYSETQLKQACYNLFKYKKVATFPKLAHILAELSDQQKENAPKQPSEKRFQGYALKSNLCGVIFASISVNTHYQSTEPPSITQLAICLKLKSVNGNTRNLNTATVMMVSSFGEFSTEKPWNWVCLIILMKH